MIDNQNDEQRVICGIASCAEQDRQGDILTPTKAEFSLPVPLLFQHDVSRPIGSVFSAEVTHSGISIRAKIARGTSFAESVWASIKSGAVGGLSVGYDPRENPTSIKGRGLRWGSWKMVEVSVCEVPANSACQIKGMDQQYLPARPGFHFQTLDELNSEFTNSETMTTEIYEEKRDAICKVNERQAARGAVKPVSRETAPITREYLRDVVKKILVNSFTRDKALGDRISSLEAIIQRPEIGDVAVVRGLERLESWLAAPVIPVFDDKGRIISARRDGANVKEKRSPTLSDVERRIKDLEDRPAMKYCGVWAADDSYTEGEFVTHSGSLWACRSPTKNKPGTSDAWQLAAKKGRDAK